MKDHIKFYLKLLIPKKSVVLKKSFFKTFRGFNKIDNCSYYFVISNTKIFTP